MLLSWESEGNAPGAQCSFVLKSLNAQVTTILTLEIEETVVRPGPV